MFGGEEQGEPLDDLLDPPSQEEEEESIDEGSEWEDVARHQKIKKRRPLREEGPGRRRGTGGSFRRKR